ncbi:hypothetical protein ABVT39_001226 [Epinephelus coioides]
MDSAATIGAAGAAHVLFRTVPQSIVFICIVFEVDIGLDRSHDVSCCFHVRMGQFVTVTIVYSLSDKDITVELKMYIYTQEPDALCLVFVAKCSFATLVHRGQSWTAPEYCHDLPCPEFKSEKTSIKDVEEHLLNETEWISTTMKNPTTSDLMAARERLSKVTGYVNSWPVLVNVTNGKTLALSWFVAPGSVPEISDPEVRLERGPKSVYVSGRVLTDAVLQVQRDTITAINEVANELRDIKTVLTAVNDTLKQLVNKK